MVALSGADYVAVIKNDPAAVQKVAITLAGAAELSVQIRQGIPGKVFVLIRANYPVLKALEYKDNESNWLKGIHKRLDKRETDADRLRLIYDSINDAVNKAGISDDIECIFAVADTNRDAKSLKKWTRKTVITDSDIEEIQGKYGSKVAMYFAFVQYYFKWSVIQAAIGASTQYLFGSYSWTFAVANMLWAISFIHGWSRREKQFAINWGDQAEAQDMGRTRQNFRGEEILDPVTGEKRLHYAAWKRIVKQLLFIPLALVSCLMLMLFQTLTFSLEIFLAQVYDGPGKSLLGLIPTVLLVGLTPVFLTFYKKAVKFTTEFENHATDLTYEEAYGQKLFAFQFLIGFMGLFLTAYVYLPSGHLIIPHLDFIRSNVASLAKRDIPIAHGFEINTARLKTQTIYMSVTAQVISLVTELIVPFALRFVFGQVEKYSGKKVIYDDEPEEQEFLQDIRKQSLLPVYDVDEDYRQLTLQFGYSLLFSPVWQYAPVAAAAFNWLQIRADLTKVVLGSKRPTPTRAASIGPWIKNLKVLSWMASITVPSVIVMFGPSLSKPALNEKDSQGLPGIVTVSPRLLILILLLSEHVYYVVNQIVAAFFRALRTREFEELDKSKYALRKKVLPAVVDEPKIDTASSKETDWPLLSAKTMDEQVSEAVKPLKTLLDKKNK